MCLFSNEINDDFFLTERINKIYRDTLVAVYRRQNREIVQNVIYNF